MTTAEFRHLFLVGAGFSADQIPPIISEEEWRVLSLQAMASIVAGEVNTLPLSKISDMAPDARTLNAKSLADMQAYLGTNQPLGLPALDINGLVPSVSIPNNPTTQIAMKTLTESRFDTTDLPDAEMSTWFDANKFYTFEAELHVSMLGQPTTGGFSFKFSGIDTSSTYARQVQTFYLQAKTNGDCATSTGYTGFTYLLTDANANPFTTYYDTGSPHTATTTIPCIMRVVGSFSTKTSGQFTLRWKQSTTDATHGTALLAGSFIKLAETSEPLNYQRSFLLNTSGTTDTVTDQGRVSAFPCFERSPDGAGKICVYSEDPYYHSSARQVALVRYLPSGATSWSSADIVMGHPDGLTGSVLAAGIKHTGNNQYLITGQNDDYPLTNTGSRIWIVKATWSNGKLVCGTPRFLSVSHVDSLGGYTAIGSSNPIEIAPNGDLLYPVYGHCTATNTDDCGFLRSTDGGATWGNFTLIHQSDNEIQMLTHGSTLYAFTRNGLKYTSTDSGATWSSGVSYSTNLTNFAGCRPAICIMPGGTWYFVYRKGTLSNADTWYARSTDQGANWTCTFLATGFQHYSWFLPTTSGCDGVYAYAATSAFDSTYPIPGGVKIKYLAVTE